tara:strand:+ start:1725 stop:1877 length:153 start_codon:yes stop_codon:yes gene_type:complete
MRFDQRLCKGLTLGLFNFVLGRRMCFNLRLCKGLTLGLIKGFVRRGEGLY